MNKYAIKAFWIDTRECYETKPQYWASLDGDNWFDCETGNPVDSKEFQQCTIELIGGPRDGEKVT